MTRAAGARKLTEARNQLLGMVAQHPDVLVGVRPNGLEDTPQFKLIVDQEKAKALGVSITTINSTLSTALVVRTSTTSSTAVV